MIRFCVLVEGRLWVQRIQSGSSTHGSLELSLEAVGLGGIRTRIGRSRVQAERRLLLLAV